MCVCVCVDSSFLSFLLSPNLPLSSMSCAEKLRALARSLNAMPLKRKCSKKWQPMR